MIRKNTSGKNLANLFNDIFCADCSFSDRDQNSYDYDGHAEGQSGLQKLAFLFKSWCTPLSLFFAKRPLIKSLSSRRRRRNVHQAIQLGAIIKV